MQRELTSVLGTVGATQVRFLYGLPFGILFLGVAITITGDAIPSFQAISVAWTAAGALAQVVATALMLAAMKERSFVVTTALVRAEPVWVAILGFALLGETFGWPLLAGIALATAGVLWLSWPAVGAGWSIRPIALGLASAAAFAASAIAFRAAMLSIDSGEAFVVKATAVMVLSLAMQAVTLMGWMLVANRALLLEVIRVWRPSLATGLLAATASQCWFLAFAIETPAKIRTLGLIEIVFAQIISRRIFSQQQNRRELIGMAVLLAGVVLVLRS